MPVFVFSSVVAAPLEGIYAFHTDPRNLEHVQPPGFRLSRLDMEGEPRPGATALIVVRVMGIRQRWRVLLESWSPPHGKPLRARVVDRALESPFGFWRHQHVFEQVDGGVRMTDVVDFEPPGGAWGWVLLPGCWITLAALFRFRHAATRRFWERTDGLPLGRPQKER